MSLAAQFAAHDRLLTHMLRALLSPVLLVALTQPSLPNDVPPLVQKFLDDARASCVKAGGTPEPKPRITSLDLNDDGHPDWIVHYEGHCPAAPSHFCDAKNNCVIEIFLGQPDGGVKLFLMQSTITWRTDRILGQPALIFYRPNEFCRDRKQRICDERYIFNRRGGFEHLR